MSLTWTVDHGKRLVVTVVSGAVSGADIERWIAERESQGAVGYRIIFDASAARGELKPAELAAFSRFASGQKPEGFDAALALIASSDAERYMSAYFARRTNAERPCRVFSNVEAAYAWFAELDAAMRD
ncbi:MAG: hypothetical protein KF889_27580 [Alphaproteobacteria bacterium]|nr:hypothetical protein [Alphaproteobacteria bacterium]MCW5743716.1 hypothetical protein [Alphaproteobacteria bacterium]